jgi:hypothetical protein
MTFDGMADFDARVLAPLAENRFFRRAPDAEIDASFAAYRSGDVGRLLAAWREGADPTRVLLPEVNARAFARAHLAPEIVNGLAFLATARAALAAGIAFRSRLRPEVQRAFASEFPWLENRHQHVPAGWAPGCAFPPAIDAFFDAPALDDAKARWQLVCALNEVVQSSYTRKLAALLALPSLNDHAAREEELAHNYFAHWSPPCSRELWRQCLIVLDGMSAAVFEACCATELRALIAFTLKGSFTRRKEWRAFLEGLKTPQWLLPAPRASAAASD